jgi:antitoxin YefM
VLAVGKGGRTPASQRLKHGVYLHVYNIAYMWRWGVKIMSMSESRANYAATLDSVVNDQEPVVITRPGGENVVMLPQREYESMRETLYLMASPVNRERISRSIDQLNAGGGQSRELADPGEGHG